MGLQVEISAFFIRAICDTGTKKNLKNTYL